MPLSIKDQETERLARELARRTGETTNVATKKAFQERLRRIGVGGDKALLLEDMAAIRRRCAAMTVLDARHPDEMIGYDEHGLGS